LRDPFSFIFLFFFSLFFFLEREALSSLLKLRRQLLLLRRRSGWSEGGPTRRSAVIDGGAAAQTLFFFVFFFALTLLPPLLYSFLGSKHPKSLLKGLDLKKKERKFILLLCSGSDCLYVLACGGCVRRWFVCVWLERLLEFGSDSDWC